MAIQAVTNQIANLAITTAKIDNLAVTRGKLENGDAGNASYGINEGKLIGAAVASGTALSLSNLVADKKYVDDAVSAGVFWKEPIESKQIATDNVKAVECIGDRVLSYKMIDDSLTAPPGGEAVGDAYVPASVASGDWTGKEGHVMEVASIGPTVWADLGLLVAGDQVIVAPSGAAGSFAGKANQIGEYDSGWTFVIPPMGVISAVVSAGVKENHVMEAYMGAWTDVRTLVNHDVLLPIGPTSTLERGQMTSWQEAHESDGAGTLTSSPYQGQAHQVNNANSDAHLHVYEYNADPGTDAFVDLDDVHMGAPPANTHFTVDYHIPPGWTSSFNGHTDEVALWDGATWSTFTAATDGEARLCIGDGSEYENCGFVWNSGLGGWQQFTGASTVIAGLGLYKSGASLNVGEKVGGAIKVEADQIGLNMDGGAPADAKGLWIDQTTPGEGQLKVRVGEDETPSIPSGLEFTGSYGALRIKCDANGGLALGVNGAAIKLDATTTPASGIALGANGARLNAFHEEFTALGGATEDFILSNTPFADHILLFVFRNGAFQYITSAVPAPESGQYKYTRATKTITVGETTAADVVFVEYLY